MEYKASISGDIVLTLEDEVSGGYCETPNANENYASLIENVPQDYLDNFLTWFGAECIKRYCDKIEK